jgi:hypothetical protein
LEQLAANNNVASALAPADQFQQRTFTAPSGRSERFHFTPRPRLKLIRRSAWSPSALTYKLDLRSRFTHQTVLASNERISTCSPTPIADTPGNRKLAQHDTTFAVPSSLVNTTTPTAFGPLKEPGVLPYRRPQQQRMTSSSFHATPDNLQPHPSGCLCLQAPCRIRDQHNMAAAADCGHVEDDRRTVRTGMPPPVAVTPDLQLPTAAPEKYRRQPASRTCHRPESSSGCVSAHRRGFANTRTPLPLTEYRRAPVLSVFRSSGCDEFANRFQLFLKGQLEGAAAILLKRQPVRLLCGQRFDNS